MARSQGRVCRCGRILLPIMGLWPKHYSDPKAQLWCKASGTRVSTRG